MTCGNHRSALLEKLGNARPFVPEMPARKTDDDAEPTKWMRITIRPSSGAAVTGWLLKHLNAGYPKLFVRSKAFLSWIVRLPLRAWGLGRASAGRRVDQNEYEKRMVACGECQSMQIYLIRKAPFKKLYCGSCGCPRSPVSELHYKNRLLKWECPLNKHERLDDPREWKRVIIAEQQWVKGEGG